MNEPSWSWELLNSCGLGIDSLFGTRSPSGAGAGPTASARAFAWVKAALRVTIVPLSCSRSVSRVLNLASSPCPSVDKASRSSVNVSGSSTCPSHSFVNCCTRCCSCCNLGFCSKGAGVPCLEIGGMVGSLPSVTARSRELRNCCLICCSAI